MRHLIRPGWLTAFSLALGLSACAGDDAGARRADGAADGSPGDAPALPDGASDPSSDGAGAGGRDGAGLGADATAGDTLDGGITPDAGEADADADAAPGDSAGTPDTGGPEVSDSDAGEDARATPDGGPGTDGDPGGDPDPCVSGADCDDGNACTLDDCAGGTCSHAFTQCDDGSWCTLDGCEPESGCVFLPVPCDDGDPCTADLCAPLTGACQHPLASCDDGDPCTSDTCGQDTGCTHVSAVGPACCAADSDCPQAPCVSSACTEGTCVVSAGAADGCCTAVVYQETFDDGVADGFVLDNGQPLGWTVQGTSTSAPSPTLYYGDPDTGSYDFGASEGSATSPLIVLPAGVQATLSFWIAMHTETSPAFDTLVVSVVTAGLEQPVWSKAADLPATGVWVEVHRDLSALAGQAVRVRFVFATGDAANNSGEGVLIDDVRVTSTCAPRPCAAGSDCADVLPATVESCEGGACAYAPNPETCVAGAACTDDDPCTKDACAAGFCTHSAASGCCLASTDCADGNPCTMDSCLGGIPGQCGHSTAIGCCTKDADCADGDPCTTGKCAAPLTPCVQAPVAGCCNADEQCDDGNACTSDRCLLHACQHTPVCCEAATDCVPESACQTAECSDASCAYATPDGCCHPVRLHLGFDDGTLGSMSSGFDNAPGDGVGWHVTQTRAFTAPSSLGLAKAGTGTYATGGIVSVAIGTAPFLVPNKAELSFRLWLENELTGGKAIVPSFDELTVTATSPGSAPVLLWSSASPPAPWWEVGPDGAMLGPMWALVPAVSLAKVAGKEAVISFRFDTFDALHNDFEGPFIDDIRVEAPCQSNP